MATSTAVATTLLDALRAVPGLRPAVPIANGALLAVDVGPTIVELRLVALELPLPPLLARAEEALRAALLGTAWADAGLRLVVTDLDAAALVGESSVTRSGHDEPR